MVMKIKILDFVNSNQLEKQVNKFLEKQEVISLIDIKYIYSEKKFHSAMIIYNDTAA